MYRCGTNSWEEVDSPYTAISKLCCQPTEIRCHSEEHNEAGPEVEGGREKHNGHHDVKHGRKDIEQHVTATHTNIKMTSSSAIKLYICMTMHTATLRLWRRLYSAAAPHAPADPIEDRSSRYCSCSLENHGDALRASVHDTNHFSCFSSQVPAYWQAVNKTMNHVTLRFKRSFSFFYMSR